VLNTSAGELSYDLAIDASGEGNPSPVAAGIELPELGGEGGVNPAIVWTLVGAAIAALVALRLGLGGARPWVARR
jgi:hypothetical protein